MGRGGTGYLTTASKDGCGLAYCPNYGEMLPSAASTQPDIVVIAGGQNDLTPAKSDPGAVAAAVKKTYADARATFPSATIIAVGPSTTGPVDRVALALDKAVLDASAAAGAKYVSLLAPEVLNRTTMLAPDGGYVNDAGHKAIAERVISTLRLKFRR